MSSIQQLLLNPPGLAGNVEAEFGVIPEAEEGSEPSLHLLNPRDNPEPVVQKRIKPRTVRTSLKKLWLDEMLLTKQILCPVPGCTMVFTTLQGIQSHYQMCTGLNESGIVRCEFCGEQFLSQSLALEIHMAEEHRHERMIGLGKSDEHPSVIKLEDRPPPRTKKFRGHQEFLAIPPSPPPPSDIIESRRKNAAFSRGQEELIDCEELEGVVRFPLRNLPKTEQEDPLQLPAVMMNLDINLKPKPFSFDDLDENSMMDDTLLSGPLKIKSEPIDNAEDDPQYISNMIKKMPEPDLKTVPPVRKRSRQLQSQCGGSDVRVVQVYLRSNPTEPNAAQSILRDPQFVDAIVQQSLGHPSKKKKKGKFLINQQQQQQQSVYVVAINDPQEQQQILTATQQKQSPHPHHQMQQQQQQPQQQQIQQPQPQQQQIGHPNIIKKPVRSRKQMFPQAPTGLVQVTASLDQGQKFLQTHTLADKPQVRQEVIDSFFNASNQAGSSGMGQPSTSYVEDSSQLVQNIQQQVSQVTQVVQQTGQSEFQTQEEFQQMQVVNSNDVLNHIGEQGCLIVPPEAFNQLEGAHLIVQDGQIIVQNRNGERVEGCQVFYASNPAAFTTEAIQQEEHFATQQMHTEDEQHHHHQQQQQQHHHHHQHHQELQDHQDQMQAVEQQSISLTQISASCHGGNQVDDVSEQQQQLIMAQQLQVIPVEDVQSHSEPVQISIIEMKDPDDQLASKNQDDADTTATQAAEALLTLRPQNRCMAPSSPLLPELLKDAVEDVRCDSEVFQIIPDPEPPSLTRSPPSSEQHASGMTPHSVDGIQQESPPAQELATENGNGGDRISIPIL